MIYLKQEKTLRENLIFIVERKKMEKKYSYIKINTWIKISELKPNQHNSSCLISFKISISSNKFYTDILFFECNRHYDTRVWTHDIFFPATFKARQEKVLQFDWQVLSSKVSKQKSYSIYIRFRDNIFRVISDMTSL